MRLLPALLALGLAALAASGHAQSPRSPSSARVLPAATRWFETVAVGTTKLGDAHPRLVVAATGDGWVLLQERDPANGIGRGRLREQPDAVRRWAAAVLAALDAGGDAARLRRADTIPPLGRGRPALVTRVAPGATGPTFTLTLMECDNGRTQPLDAPAARTLATTLARAARLARQLRDQPLPPTLDRPYLTSEVSCAAGELPTRTLPPPADLPAAERRYREVPVRYVVDTLGLAEPGSLVLLPGTPEALARVARAVVESEQRRPAFWAGQPVRQVASRVLVFDPLRPNPPLRPEEQYGPRQRAADSTAAEDGWVYVRRGTWQGDGSFLGMQEWYPPEAVEGWIARVRGLPRPDSARVVRWPYELRATLSAGEYGNHLVAGYGQLGPTPPVGPPPLTVTVEGCALFGRVDSLTPALLDTLARLARAARAQRPTPAPQATRAYGRGETACPAHARPIGSWTTPAPDEPWSASAPTPYPSALAARHARDELVTTFVIDTLGVPDPSTLEVLPGADPVSVEALRGALRRSRYTTALRGGRPVPMRVTRVWHVVPPPTCLSGASDGTCARRYRRGP